MCGTFSGREDFVALILGGTKGLGREIAVQRLALGEEVTIVGRSDASADPALARAKHVIADVCTAEGRAKVMASIAPYARFIDTVMLSTGAYLKGPLAKASDDDIAAAAQSLWIGPLQFLAQFHALAVEVRADHGKQPYQVIAIGSVLAHVPGRQHTVLSGAKAAMVHSLRVFSQELSKDLPGSTMLIVNPWGMKTSFFDGHGVKTDGFMDPAWVAQTIHDEFMQLPIKASREGKGVWPTEITLDRAKDGSTEILRGPQAPKMK